MPDTHDIGRLLTHSVQLDPGAPVAHTATTAEFDDPMRYSRSLVLKTGLRRKGRWHGIRKSWLSVQVKLPTGEPLTDAVWGIVLGWWRYPKHEDWSALLRAVRLGKEPDGDDTTNFELPTSESIRGATRDVDRRRTDAVTEPGADGQ